MTDIRDLVDTVILVMMENRSFDHMLGHLSQEGLKTVDGLEPDFSQQKYENLFNGRSFRPFRMKDRMLAFDLPHEFDEVAVQMARSPVTDEFTMTGFVRSYATANGIVPNLEADPMGFFPSDQVPMTSFLGRNFTVCDRWFSALPTSTQPNRTMAFCGTSQIFDTKLRGIPTNTILFDWLEANGVRWRVYHDGLSFFALYPRAISFVLGPHFRRFERFAADMLTEPAAQAPQVIVVEPSYHDAPHIGSDQPNDNHAPLAVGFGEEFLRQVYHAATANPDRWRKTVMVLYYDEHGGFWDHVPPPDIPYTTRGTPSRTFDSLGPRIPGIVISPLARESVCSEVMDHTSVLQFLAELFTPGRPYSEDVEERRQHGVRSLSAALADSAREDIPTAPAELIQASAHLGPRPATGMMEQAFENAANRLLEDHPAETAQVYPELFQWRASQQHNAGVAPPA